MAYQIVKVKFADGSEEYYGSIAAIYDYHSPGEIGFTKEMVYKSKFTSGVLVTSKECEISRVEVRRKKQQDGKSFD